MATQKEDIKALIGRSPDISDTLIMRMYFVVRSQLTPYLSENSAIVADKLRTQFSANIYRQGLNSTK